MFLYYYLLVFKNEGIIKLIDGVINTFIDYLIVTNGWLEMI